MTSAFHEPVLELDDAVCAYVKLLQQSRSGIRWNLLEDFIQEYRGRLQTMAGVWRLA